MGKVVPLPNNDTRHLGLGKNALAQKNYASAVAHLEKAYKEAPRYPAAKLLVQALNGLKQPKEAVPYISEYMEDFLDDASSTTLLFDTLLALPDYRFAWAVLQHVKAPAKPAVEARINQAEQQDLAAHADEIAALKKKLAHLGGFDPHQQEKMLGEIGRLPKKELVQAARPNLIDEDVHPAIRISLLDALTAVGDDEEIPLLSYSGQKSVNPSKLTGVLNDPTLLQVLNQVQLQIGIDNPDLMQGTVDVLRFELGYLYPFIGEVIKNPVHFATSYLHKDKQAGTAQEREIIAWMNTQTGKLMNMA